MSMSTIKLRVGYGTKTMMWCWFLADLLVSVH